MQRGACAERHQAELGCGGGQGATDGRSRVLRAGGPALRRALPARLSLPGLPVNMTGDPINTSSLSNHGVPGFSAWVSEETQSPTTALVLPRVPVWTLLLRTIVPERQSSVGFKAALDREAGRIYSCLHPVQLTQVLHENSLLILVVESLSRA